ncbi:MAG TPA: N,N-dimethylformamidase beta subunit family domain-containing protein [Myxococcaceae bacterium]
MAEPAPPGDPSWRKGKPASAAQLEVKTSRQSALAGEEIAVEVSSRDTTTVRAEVFRLGFYGGAGALRVWNGGTYAVSPRQACAQATVGAVAPCPEQKTFAFEVADDWEPGLYLLKVTRSDGRRSFTSLVIKDRDSAAPSP